MIFRSPKRRGFTIIELVVVIVVIGVLSTVATVSYRGVQKDARDSERETDVQILVAGLERYYDENGSYPGGSTVSGDVTNFFTTQLDIPAQSTMPPQGIALLYTTSNTASTVYRTDRYSYRPATAADVACYNTSASNTCTRYIIRYKTEASGQDIDVRSRYGW